MGRVKTKESAAPHVVLEVVLEGMQTEGREGDRAPAGFGLGGSEHRTRPGQLIGLALHCHGAVERVDVPSLRANVA